MTGSQGYAEGDAAPDDSDFSLTAKMYATIQRLPPGGVTLLEIRNLIGREGMMLLTTFLTIIFLVPVSIPGVSTVFGGGILLLSVSRLIGRPLWIPQRIGRRHVSTEKLRRGMERGLKWFGRLERISRPHRMPWLMRGRFAGTVNDLGLILGAVLLMAPFGLIPFSNTIPAIALLFLAIGILQRDGVCILLGHLSNIASIVYFAVLIGGGAVALREAWDRLTA